MMKGERSLFSDAITILSAGNPEYRVLVVIIFGVLTKCSKFALLCKIFNQMPSINLIICVSYKNDLQLTRLSMKYLVPIFMNVFYQFNSYCQIWFIYLLMLEAFTKCS